MKMAALTAPLWTELWSERHSKSLSEQKRDERLRSKAVIHLRSNCIVCRRVQIALKEVALVFGGFSCLCRKGRKEGEERWRHSELHRAKQSRTKGESSNTNCRSEWPHHKRLLLHPESRQLLARASKLRFSDCFSFFLAGRLKSPSLLQNETDQKGRESFKPWVSQKKKTSLKSLKTKSELILTICTFCCQKKTRVCFESRSLRKGIKHSRSFFSLSLLLPETHCRYKNKSMHVEPRSRQAHVYRHVSSRPF